MTVPRLPETVTAGAVCLYRRRVADVPELANAIETSASALGRFIWWAAHVASTADEVERESSDGRLSNCCPAHIDLQLRLGLPPLGYG